MRVRFLLGAPNMWYVYIVKCRDGTYYTGITQNVEKRINQHNTKNAIGAKYTRSRRPVQFVYRLHVRTKSEALKREAEIKRLPHALKKKLILSR